MSLIRMLDCTLRDGGYILGWKFGEENIKKIISALTEANIEFVELGYLRNNYKMDIDSTCNSFVEVFDTLVRTYQKAKCMFLLMIDLGEYSVDHLANAKDSVIGGIRLTFKKGDVLDAFRTAEKILNKGYKLFLQPVSITDYSLKDYRELIRIMDDLEPFSISIVDTYGLLNPNQLDEYLRIADELRKTKFIGYHGHNSKQLVHANIVNIINNNYQHPLIVDSTMMGMGKDSGNACTELVAEFINEKKSHYQIEIIAQLINDIIIKYKNEYSWGYNFIGYISSLCHCRTEYTKYILEKKPNDLEEAIHILDLIDRDKKTYNFYLQHIEKLYSVNAKHNEEI